ncbi:uncharacterized protein LOC124440905 isoform X2 [Xenia sp. Carnegie-2017]|nr:uncharacterized protein LOC124440905 isoform X2 [Xenia sp. Carnegie-2017]XP_046847284.1 uncharacterized protein LOC124440905 isoform X2 [Xenia sp. Carnegie-2017]
MKKYFYEDLKAMSSIAREVWMCEQCSEFGYEIERLMTERERQNFTEEMYRKLRQVTKKWTSWHHKSFGNVSSRQSVAELLAWERSTTLLVSPVIKTRNNAGSQNVLERFQELCRDLDGLQQNFTSDILDPMCDFFWPSTQNVKLDRVVESLKTLLSRWKSLLAPGCIDQSLLSESSSKHLHTFTLRGRIYDFDAVIRLVPDLLEKANLALNVVRQWRIIHKEICVSRQKSFSLSPPSTGRSKSGSFGELEKRSNEDELRCSSLKKDIETYREKYEQLQKDLNEHFKLCEQLEDEVNKAEMNCNMAKQRFDEAKNDSRKEQCIEALKQDFNRSKVKFTTQRIKLVNARKRSVTLSDKLVKTRKEYETLKLEGEISQNKSQAVRKQLEYFRKNIKIQAGMVDSLQQQCYALKKELDSSKAGCEKVTQSLTDAQTKCDRLEEKLRLKESECFKMKNDLNSALQREQLVREENIKLKTLKKGIFTNRKTPLPLER